MCISIHQLFLVPQVSDAIVVDGEKLLSSEESEIESDEEERERR